jgi:hypothetical protein
VVDELIIGIEEGDWPSELQKRLDNLPPDLEELYKRIIDQIPIHNLHDTINYFSVLFAYERMERGWEHYEYLHFTLAASCKPLEALEIHIQATVNTERYTELCKQMTQRLKSRCRTLVQIVPRPNGQQFAYDWSDSDESDASEDTTATSGSWRTPYDPLFEYSVELVHRTVGEYPCTPVVDRTLRSKVNHELLQNPHVSLMAASLHLFKTAVPWPLRALETNHPIDLEEEAPFRWTGMCPAYNLLGRFMQEALNAEISTGFAQTRYLDELDRILPKVYHGWAASTISRYDDPFGRTRYQEGEIDILSIATQGNMVLYIKDKLSTKEFTLRRKSTRPLLLSVFDLGETREYGDMISLLLENGAQPNEFWTGTSIWESAIKSGTRKDASNGAGWDAAFALMLKYGANPNQLVVREDGFSTALNLSLSKLMEARTGWPWNPDWNVIRTFLEYGANPDIKDSDGVSARDLAMREDCNPKAMEIIAEFEACLPASSKRRHSQLSFEEDEGGVSKTCAIAKRGKLLDDSEGA